MSKFRKQILRKLQRDLKDLDKLIQSKRSKLHNAGFDEWREAVAAENSKRRDLEEQIARWETILLIDQTKSLGIELFPPHTSEAALTSYWHINEDEEETGYPYLSDEGLIIVKNRIIEARFNYWKRWIDIVAPVGSLIISIIALIVAIIAINK